MRLTQAERQGEVEWLTSLGLKVPEGGVLLEAPFAQPFSARSMLAPTSWWRETPPREIAADALRGDLPLLRIVMERAYGGWDSAQKRGWDWNRWFEEWDRDLAAKGTVKLQPSGAFAAFGRLEAVQLDNHSGPVGLPLFQSGSRSAALDSAPVGACTQMRTADGAVFALDPKDPAQNARKALIVGDVNVPERAGYYFSYPARRGILASVECGGTWIAARPTWAHSKQRMIANLAGQSGNAPSYRMLSGDIGYLRLPTFSKENGELLRKLVAALPESAGREKVLIVDMRGNEGGDEPVASLGRWLDAASARKVMQGFGRRMPQSCVYTALRWGYEQYTMKDVKPPLTDRLRGTLQAQLDELIAPAEGCPVTLQEKATAWGYREHRITVEPPAGKPRLLLLVDNECGSDCEFMTYLLSAESGSVVAGENTFGVGQFMQPGYFILPRSRVPFRIALGMSDIYGDGRSVDGYGLDVDILLPTEESQGAPAILRLANRMLEQLR